MRFTDDRGTTLIVVLIAMSFIAFLSVILVEYGIWHSRLGSVNHDTVHMHQAHRLAETRTRTYLKETLPDSPVLPAEKQLEWKLPPGETRVQATIRSLNAKISLNRFKQANAGETFKNLVESLLDELNYPDRAMRELARWIVSPEEQSGLGQGPYGGYNYSAPNRKILHLDEVKLISGFREIGLKDHFRQLFTVYGTGNVNPLHFTPEQWRLVESAMQERLPSIPPSALRSRKALREYLGQDDVWGDISESVPFFSRRDDSFLVDFDIERGNSHIRRRAVLTFDYDNEKVELVTRYPIGINYSEESDET